MRPHFSDQEARSILNARKMARDAEWLRGQIGDETYITSLMILGYKPKSEAETELALLKLEKRVTGLEAVLESIRQFGSDT